MDSSNYFLKAQLLEVTFTGSNGVHFKTQLG